MDMTDFSEINRACLAQQHNHRYNPASRLLNLLRGNKNLAFLYRKRHRAGDGLPAMTGLPGADVLNGWKAVPPTQQATRTDIIGGRSGGNYAVELKIHAGLVNYYNIRR